MSNSQVQAANGPPLARLLQLVHQRHQLSRAQVTRQLGLSRTSVGQLLDELRNLGLLCVCSPEQRPGGPGRPSPVVEIDAHGPIVLAAQIRQSYLELASVRLGGRIASLETAEADPTDPAEVGKRLAHWINGAQARRTGARILGVAVAVPGLVRGDGFVHSAEHLGWESVALKASLSAQTRGKLPIEIGNDANYAALGEYRQGAGAGASTLLCLVAENVGVGGGLVINGELFTGSAGYGLEAGHLQVNPRGRRCSCGARGCLQVQCDSVALLEAARQKTAGRDPAAANQILDAARRGDLHCRAAVEQVADWLAIGLTGLVNLINPDRIVLTGLHREILRQQHNRIIASIRGNALVAQATELSIVAGTLDEPVLLGAAERAFESLLRNPRLARPHG